MKLYEIKNFEAGLFDRKTGEKTIKVKNDKDYQEGDIIRFIELNTSYRIIDENTLYRITGVFRRIWTRYRRLYIEYFRYKGELENDCNKRIH